MKITTCDSCGKKVSAFHVVYQQMVPQITSEFVREQQFCNCMCAFDWLRANTAVGTVVDGIAKNAEESA